MIKNFSPVHALDWAHERCIRHRRAAVLAAHLANVIPPARTVLDVGCGDGRVAQLVRAARPELDIRGLEVAPRAAACIPVRGFDGCTLPYPNASVDVVLFIDVLHHTQDPLVLLREAGRVARRAVVIKDHVRDGWGSWATLRFMDYVGNRRFGVSLPFNYWRRTQWIQAFESLAWRTECWIHQLDLYRKPASWIFDRSLHFLARLAVPSLS